MRLLRTIISESVSAIAISTLFCGYGCPAQSPAEELRAKISIDCAASQGALLRTERINNLANAEAFAAQRPEDVRFFNDQGLHGSIYRVWITDKAIYDPKSNTFDYSGFSAYLSEASTLSDSLLVNFGISASMHEIPPDSAEQLKPMIKRIVKDLKQAYPRIKFIEAFNEPDWEFKANLKPEDLYKYYVPFYEAVNEVNAELSPAVPLQVGGPALFQFSLPWLRAFLDAYQHDKNPGKRLDFISYHGYLDFTAGRMFKGNPSEVSSQRPKLDKELNSRGLDVNTPSFITEEGLYPGPSFDEAKGYNDMLRQAAGMPSFLYWYMEDPKVVPFNWVFRHRVEERKDQLVTRVPGDASLVPTGEFTPYGNTMVMMSKLKMTRVSATSDSIRDGKGMYALASEDSSGVSVLVWNYQHIKTTHYIAEIGISNLPSILTGRNVREKVYRIDSKTSNYYSNHDHGNLQIVSDRIAVLGNSWRKSLEFEPNSLQLIVLEPVKNNLVLESTFDDEVTGAYPGWTVSEPTGANVAVTGLPSSTNRSAFLSSASEPASITRKFPNQTATISAEWRFMEKSPQALDMFQLTSGSTDAIEVRIESDRGLFVNGRRFSSVNPDSWHELKVVADIPKHTLAVYLDRLELGKDIAFSTPVTELDGIRVATSGADKTALYLDAVYVAKGKKIPSVK